MKQAARFFGSVFCGQTDGQFRKVCPCITFAQTVSFPLRITWRVGAKSSVTMRQMPVGF